MSSQSFSTRQQINQRQIYFFNIYKNDQSDNIEKLIFQDKQLRNKR